MLIIFYFKFFCRVLQSNKEVSDGSLVVSKIASTSILSLGASLELLLETSMAVLHHFFRIIISTSVGICTGNLTGNIARNDTMNSTGSFTRKYRYKHRTIIYTFYVSLSFSVSIEQFHVHIFIVSP